MPKQTIPMKCQALTDNCNEMMSTIAIKWETLADDSHKMSSLIFLQSEKDNKI